LKPERLGRHTFERLFGFSALASIAILLLGIVVALIPSTHLANALWLRIVFVVSTVIFGAGTWLFLWLRSKRIQTEGVREGDPSVAVDPVVTVVEDPRSVAIGFVRFVPTLLSWAFVVAVVVAVLITFVAISAVALGIARDQFSLVTTLWTLAGLVLLWCVAVAIRFYGFLFRDPARIRLLRSKFPSAEIWANETTVSLSALVTADAGLRMSLSSRTYISIESSLVIWRVNRLQLTEALQIPFSTLDSVGIADVQIGFTSIPGVRIQLNRGGPHTSALEIRPFTKASNVGKSGETFIADLAAAKATAAMEDNTPG
jgi:hypothetical protein